MNRDKKKGLKEIVFDVMEKSTATNVLSAP